MKKFFLSTVFALMALCASALSIGDSFSVDDLTYVLKSYGVRGSSYVMFFQMIGSIFLEAVCVGQISVVAYAVIGSSAEVAVF